MTPTERLSQRLIDLNLKLAKVKARMSAASSAANHGGERMPPDEWADLRVEKATLRSQIDRIQAQLTLASTAAPSDPLPQGQLTREQELIGELVHTHGWRWQACGVLRRPWKG